LRAAIRTDAQFRLLVESVADYAIYLLDTSGRVMSWNAGAQRIKGYSAGEILGRHFSLFYPPESAPPEGRRRCSIRRPRKAHERPGLAPAPRRQRFWADVVITALRNRAGMLTAMPR